jgi:hypothetical protein
MMTNEKKPTGPEPERLKLRGDWMEAVEKAVKKPKSSAGWPEPRGRYSNKKTRLKSK